MRQLTVVVAPINLLLGDIDGNTQRIITATQRAIEEFQADLVLFPEMAISGYPPEDLLLRADFLQHCEQALKKITQANLAATLVVGYPQQHQNYIYNQVAVIQHGRVIASYAKQQLPNYRVFDEKRYFHPGNSPGIFTLNGIKIGVLICEDIWFATPGAQAVQAGAQLLVVLNASPFDHHKAKVRETIIQQRINETHVPIIYANLVGGQDELIFDGGSMVFNHLAQRCQQANFFAEQLMPVHLEIDSNNRVQISPQPLPKKTSEEENIYQALVLGVHDYIRKNNFPGAIIGLSGGIDSALTLAITVDAIGAENTEAVLMPSRFTSAMSMEDAIQQAIILGVHYTILDIEPIFKVFLNTLDESFKGYAADTTEENLQARIRGTLLMALSNKKGSIVLTTGNKSEMSVGYATLYGDMAGGFGVLKDVFKTMVYRLANYRNAIAHVIPQRVIDRPPSAELAPDQIDQDSLPPYPLLDDILLRYIELDQSPETICAAGIDKAMVDRVIKMINRNEYKRRQAPIGIRITERAFGKDRRYPITNGWK